MFTESVHAYPSQTINKSPSVLKWSLWAYKGLAGLNILTIIGCMCFLAKKNKGHKCCRMGQTMGPPYSQSASSPPVNSGHKYPPTRFHLTSSRAPSRGYSSPNHTLSQFHNICCCFRYPTLL
ncbi:hypothetical protein PAXRUDRAFT_598861 [Paxillus rubicundulus Ve08.2h10]|uniref:Uncharacterized protein n=1 Tax=Paxillus rubicundulus Ve08.2h10 TaxID=930991 RepID=A0A0D0DNZ6_9AGAM|nr:hypothetical protein PAXRUDRAFT_598861 [Paxillus rubicundulus Ve08.2h10]